MDCNSVLDSKAFQWLDGRVNPSLLAFTYFFAGIGLFLVSSISSLTFLVYLSTVTIPIVIYSFYYQALVVKKWCRFCLMIQGVLILEALAVSGGLFWSGGLDVSVAGLFLVLFTGIILGGIPIKPMLGLKMHTLLDYDGKFTVYVNITEGSVGDNKGAYDIPLEKGSVIVADRYYNDFPMLNVWDSNGVFFVARHKNNLAFSTVGERNCPSIPPGMCSKTKKSN